MQERSDKRREDGFRLSFPCSRTRSCLVKMLLERTAMGTRNGQRRKLQAKLRKWRRLQRPARASETEVFFMKPKSRS